MITEECHWTFNHLTCQRKHFTPLFVDKKIVNLCHREEFCSSSRASLLFTLMWAAKATCPAQPTSSFLKRKNTETFNITTLDKIREISISTWNNFIIETYQACQKFLLLSWRAQESHSIRYFIIFWWWYHDFAPLKGTQGRSKEKVRIKW